MKAVGRVTVAALIAIGLSMFPMETYAVQLTCAPGDTSSVTVDLDSWTGGIVCGDKRYDLVSGSDGLPDDTTITVLKLSEDQYRLVLGFPTGYTDDNGINTFEYTVQVLSPSTSVITAISLGVDSDGDLFLGEVEVNKALFDINDSPLGTLQSLDSQPDSQTGLSTPFLRVSETIEVSGTNASISSISNTILQETPQVPLPGTLTLLGLGLLGAGLWHRRKSA